MVGMAKERRKPKRIQPQTWAQRLYGLRTYLGLNQEEMAKRLAISQSLCSRIEAGERIPSGPLALLIEHLENNAK